MVSVLVAAVTRLAYRH